MSRFRLRYQATDLELPEGEFVIGRSSACNLALDDALVSRQHATFRLEGDLVAVEDLGSRNGVLVNGVRIEGKRAVKHLDRVTIGSQEIVLIEVGRKRRAAPTGEATKCHVCGTYVTDGEVRCPSCGVAVVRGGATLAGQTLEMRIPIREDSDPDDVTRQATGFSLLAGIAQKALTMGRFDEAERILGKHLDNMLRRIQGGKAATAETVAEATPYALRLAEGLGSGKWVDWVFRIHGAAERLPSADVVDGLYEVVQKTGHADARALREYLARLQPLRDKLSPAEKFLVSRLEGLERVISA